MRNVLVLIIMATIIVIVKPAMSEILFYDDCEDMYQTFEWKREGGSVISSTDYSRSGSRSYKFTQQTTDERSELVLLYQNLGNLKFNTDYWFGYSFYVEKSWVIPNANGWCAIGQWHFYPDDCDGGWSRGGGQPLIFYLKETDTKPYLLAKIYADPIKCNTSSVWKTTGVYQSSSFVKGGWNDVVVRVRFNHSSAGINEGWLNGVKFMGQSTKANSYNDNHAPYFKIGLYSGKGNSSTIYIDEIRIGDADSSYSEVAPKGSSVTQLKPLGAPALKITSGTQ